MKQSNDRTDQPMDTVNLASGMDRREFLKLAGGLTFLSLAPIGESLFAVRAFGDQATKPLPNFTALPYIQPGIGSRLVDKSESMILAWQTEPGGVDFKVSYGERKNTEHKAQIVSNPRITGDTGEHLERINYAASMIGLSLGKKYRYKVTGNDQLIAEGYFTTRRKAGEKIRFVAFGDNAFGDPGEKAVAYYAYKTAPDFIMNTGDNVYDSGLDSEYAKYFYPVYNCPNPSPQTGAPLISSLPFYTVMANHDVARTLPDSSPAADFDKQPGSLGYFTSMYLPMNGPTNLKLSIPTIGTGEVFDQFKKCAGDRFPLMRNYSFDYGCAHFCCLDSNLYIDPTEQALLEWVDQDLGSSTAIWNFVVYHHPGFNAGGKHNQHQQMRYLTPLLEKHNVDMVLCGHEHVYQRSKPFTFTPKDTSKATDIGKPDRRIPGDFKLDELFDGKTVTRPNGIIYITTGAGGKALYDPGYDNAPEKWLHPDDNNVAYVARFISSVHSFTLFDLDEKKLIMTQIDETGAEIDRIVVTKSA